MALLRRLNPLEYSLLRTLVLLCYSAPLWLVVRPRRFFDPSELPTAAELVELGPELASECAAFLDRADLPAVQVADPAQARLNRDQLWKAFFLRVNGRDVEVNHPDLPKLADFAGRHPELTTVAVSVMEPGKSLMVHPGPMKGVLRVHVGVLVPTDGRCEMQVGGASRRWEPGGVMVFDDTFLHRAVNLTSERRAVLFLDLERPLPWPWLAALNGSFIRSLGRLRHADRIIARAEDRRRLACAD